MKKITKNHIIILTVVILFIFFFLFYGPPDLISRTSTPAFCNSCHVMEYQHEAWFLSGLHRSIKCVDCHLPNNNHFNHLLWKGLDGMKDVIFFYGRIYSDSITITDHGQNTIRENCIRCHNEMVSRLLDSTRNCWECHRRVMHNYPHLSSL